MNQFVTNLFATTYYKRSQGRTVRRATGFACFILFAVCAYQSSVYFQESYGFEAGYIAAAVIGLFGLWFSYRLVNYTRFADFLISVEAEMSKVSWPSRDELYRSSLVVLITMFFLATMLFCYDLIWRVSIEGLKGLLDFFFFPSL